ncbi:MAG: hypothetical protein U0744_13025 [Gemmataceae bacterium]
MDRQCDLLEVVHLVCPRGALSDARDGGDEQKNHEDVHEQQHAGEDHAGDGEAAAAEAGVAVAVADREDAEHDRRDGGDQRQEERWEAEDQRPDRFAAGFHRLRKAAIVGLRKRRHIPPGLPRLKRLPFRGTAGQFFRDQDAFIRGFRRRRFDDGLATRAADLLACLSGRVVEGSPAGAVHLRHG